MELEKIFYHAISEKIGRDFDLSQEDLTVSPLKFSGSYDEYLKKVIEYLFSDFVRFLKEVKDTERPFRDYVSIDDLIYVYSNWDIDILIKSLKVNVK